MKVLIAGGGTGGHIFPAISIAEEIIGRSADNDVLFVGTLRGLEKELINKKGFNIEYIRTTGMVGKGMISKAFSLFNAFKGVIDSMRIIRNYKPDIVIGVGGYVSGPVVLSARLMALPTAICEQNSVPGLTNRILSKITNRIFATFDESLRFFNPGKTVITGNPVRNEVLNAASGQNNGNKDSFTVFITGGSQGASGINTIVPRAMGEIRDKNIRIIHQTGSGELEKVRNLYDTMDLRAEVHAFLDNIGDIYRESDLVISRAGAGAVSELTSLGKPSILIPYPHAANNHQLTNARFMENSGAALIVEENNLDHIIFSKIVDKILNKQTLDEMSRRSSELGKPDAAKTIADEIIKLVERK